MATRRTPPTAREMIAPNLEAMSKTLDQRLTEAKAKGDEKEVERLNLAAGVTSAATGLVTGIPDLAVMGYNFGTASNVKDLRTRILEAAGVPTQASDPSNDLTYNLPEYAVMAWGVGSLLRSGWKGMTNMRDARKIREFTKNLPPQQANRFSRFMMNGQGSDDPMVQAALAQLKRDPTYAELFNKLDRAATDEAIRGMTPRPSRLSPQEATDKAVTAVDNQITALRRARDTAANTNFTRAYALAGDRGLVQPNNVLAGLNRLRSRYANVDTPEARKMLQTIDRLEDTFAPRVNVPSVSATNVSQTVNPVRYDSLGMPISAPQTRNVTIPGREGFTVRQSPQPLTVPQIQQLMSEFGKKIGQEDAIIQGLSQADLDVLNKTVFATLKTDLDDALRTATSADDKKALGALVSAREQYAKASDAYNQAISQGIPKFLQNKSLAEIDPEMLFSEYKKLNPTQREAFRTWVSSSSPEALQSLDNRAFETFVSKAYTQLPDGTMGIDLGKLSQNWAKLQQADKADQADMIARALGTNAGEFNQRMKDALVFTRRMEVGSVTPDPQTQTLMSRLRATLPGAVGSTTAGYQGAKVTDLALQGTEAVSQGLMNKVNLRPELLMRALMTDEGAEFLRSAALSPNGAKTLEALTKVEAALPASRAYTALSAVITGATPREADVVIPDDIFVPDDLFSPGLQQATQPQEDTGEVFIPDDLFGTPQGNFPQPTSAGERRMAAEVADVVRNAPPIPYQQQVQGAMRDNPGLTQEEINRRLMLGVQ